MSVIGSALTYLDYGLASAKTRARSVSARPWSRVWYVAELRDWSVSWDARNLSSHLGQAGIDMKTTTIPSGVSSQIVHYGSRSLYLLGRRLKCDDSNRTVFTWFHGSEKDPSPANQRMIELLPGASEKADAILTSSSIARNRLAGWGVDESKLRVIPLGADTRAFTPTDDPTRTRMRESAGVPINALCIGSFHKDGEGWAEGDRPKYEKAPEILVEAVAGLAKAISPRPVHVLLTGPARGFVKTQLDRANIRYSHIVVPDFRLLPPLYGALDMYLVPSRDEGGPKGLLEAMSSGVPVVSTRVGMAVDIVEHGVNGVLADVDDAGGLAAGMRWLAEDRVTHERLALNGRRLAERHDWSHIANRYATELYHPLLAEGRASTERSQQVPAERPDRAA